MKSRCCSNRNCTEFYYKNYSLITCNNYAETYDDNLWQKLKLGNVIPAGCNTTLTIFFIIKFLFFANVGNLIIDTHKHSTADDLVMYLALR